MQELADAEDAATEASFQASKPVSKASPPVIPGSQAVPIAVDDTPTERATSPRRVDPNVQEYPVEPQLPTREYGPRPEPEVYPCPYIMNDRQWTEQEHAAHLHKEKNILA